MERSQKLESCFNVVRSNHPPTPPLSPKPYPYLWTQLREWQLPGFSPSLTSKVPYPLLHHSMFESDPPPLALTQAYCSLSAARLNRDCWLVVELEKEALGVFIETLSFTRTITTLPHTEREANWLLVSHLRGNVHTRTRFVLVNTVTVHSC